MHIYFDVKLSLIYETDDKHLQGRAHDNKTFLPDSFVYCVMNKYYTTDI
jgi:hypothetical protein